MADRILLSQATVGAAEEEAVLRGLRSGWIAPLGPEVDAFEAEVAERCGVKYALALSSGTAALHVALLSLGVTNGDMVPVPTMTFAATTNAIAYVGATPVFIDCLPDGNIDPQLLLSTIDDLQEEGHRVPVAVTVDLMGRCCNYPDIVGGLAARDVILLADAAESLGARVDGKAAGSFGHAAAVSFNGNKIMTTSGGGMLLSDDAEIIKYARYLSTQARQPTPWYEHTEIGYNYRLSNILAALGRVQLSRLDEFMTRRHQIRARYSELGQKLGFRLLGQIPCEYEHEENGWLTTMVLPESSSVSPSELIMELAKHNIEARHIWKPMHLQPVYEGAQVVGGEMAEKLFAHAVTLPSGAGLSDAQIDRVCAALEEVLS